MTMLPLKAKCEELGDNENLNLSLIRKGEKCSTSFVLNGVVIEENYTEICYFLKDIREDVAVKMDPGLLVVLARSQEWLKKYGYEESFTVHSGYRTVKTNRETENAAYNSMHMHGKAVDVSHPRLTPKYLSLLFAAFGGTGIGVYSSFVHVDTWNKRSWHG